jgi:hypothetical protein
VKIKLNNKKLKTLSDFVAFYLPQVWRFFYFSKRNRKETLDSLFLKVVKFN